MGVTGASVAVPARQQGPGLGNDIQIPFHG